MKTTFIPLSLAVTLGLIAVVPGSRAADTSAPAPSSELNFKSHPASIHGTKIRKSLFADPHLITVAAIDKRVLPNFEGNWQKDLTITPGKHFISLRYFYRDKIAKSILPLVVEPEAHYEVRFKYSDEWVDLWIVDLVTGKTVTTVARVTPIYDATRDSSKARWVPTDGNMPDPALMDRPKNQSPTASAWGVIP